MTPAQFKVVAELLRSRDPVRSAAKAALVDGVSTSEAAAEAGVSSQSVSNALARFKAAHEKIGSAYTSKQK